MTHDDRQATGTLVGADLFRLDGCTAIITGGAGAIGGAIARGFIAAGARVAIADRDAAGVTATVEQLTLAGDDALALPLDVMD